MVRPPRDTKLPAPYLQRVFVDNPDAVFPDGYPFDLPWLNSEFELDLNTPVTILMGENGSGKSTLLEALAVLAGFLTTGGGAWADPDLSGQSSDAGALASYLRGAWLPKVQRGWFLKAQGFADISRMMQKDYLAFSHGEGFAEMMLDRMDGQGIYFLDEPEAALSPRRQAQVLAFLADVQAEASAQVIMATHSPILMAVPGATLLRISHRGITPVSLRETDHFQLWASFTADTDAFVQAAMDGELDTLA